MQDDKDKSRYYSELIWILTSAFIDNKYKANPFTKDNIKNIEKVIPVSNITVNIHNIENYNFKSVSEVSNYLLIFKKDTEIFSNPLVIIPYISDRYIVRDFYLANLIKIYANYDILYINCPDPSKITTKIYNAILTSDELIKRLPEIIQNGC